MILAVVSSDTISGIPALLIGSGGDDPLEAAFAPGAGMVCCSLRHRGEQVLGLRHGLAGYVEQRSTMGIPLLYPWANRLAGARFEVAGAAVDVSRAEPPPKLDGDGLPIHGLLTAAPGWSVERHAESDPGAVLAAAFRLEPGGPLTAGFPFPHLLRLEARASGPLLTMTTTIDADSGSPVPVAFGFHPYFALPGSRRERWQISVPLSERLVLDERGIPTGAREPSQPLTGPLGARTFDDAFVAPAAGDAFALWDDTRRIEVRFGAGFGYAQLYAPPGEELIAYEPMTAPTNALLTGGPGLTVVEPGGSWSASFEIEVTGARA